MENHDIESLESAFKKAGEWGEKIPLGIFYKEEREIFRDKFAGLKNEEILVNRNLSGIEIGELIKDLQ